MSKLKIGDRVTCIEKHGWAEPGEKGTIIVDYGDHCGVKFDNMKNGHDLGGYLSKDVKYKGWNIYYSKLMLSDKVSENIELDYPIY
jgi:hypothetical protein